MTWKERRIVTILTTILLVLMAALLIVLGIRYRVSRALQEETAGPGEAAVTDPAAYTTLQYNNGSTTLSFSKNETGVWAWDGNQEFPLDDTVVSSILELLSNWKPQQTLTGAEAIEKSGLAQPTASLTAGTAGGASTTVLFGSATTDGSSYYVRLNGDETTVYIVADSLYKLMQIPVYDMYDLPQLPELRESCIQSIVLQGTPAADHPGPVTVLTAQQATDDAAATWRSSGANVTDLPLVRSLMEDITSLTFAKCVDFNPSDQAASICGFDAPDATLEIQYATEGGTQQTLSFSIGTRLPDRSGRYVRLGDDPTIFALSTELLDPLMRIAAEGLGD